MEIIYRSCKYSKILIFGLLFLLSSVYSNSQIFANNIRVTNVELSETDAQTYSISFNLSWENSWRTSNLFPEDGFEVGNWDAAWIFVKYKMGDGDWSHAYLIDSQSSFEAEQASANIRFGRVNENTPYDPINNPNVGAFIFRKEEGLGPFALEDISIQWDLSTVDGDLDQPIELKVFAIEMVYVPAGDFYLGSGGKSPREFHQVIPDRLEYPPFFMTAEWNRRFSTFGGSTLGQRQTLGAGGIVDPLFPTGVDGFYGMKYELSQQQYSDFLQTLTRYQFDRRYYPYGERNFIRSNRAWEPIYVAATNLTWIDMAAYLDWAGLRAMTEFEFEKAARGPKFPVPDEFAWGTDSIATKVYTYKNRETAFEQIEEHYLQDGVTGNAIYDLTQSIGPVRVGIFATSESDRISAGAGYYGMLDLSGNVFEYVVAVGLTQGRSYQGNHGDGLLSFGGEANEQSWPGLRGGIVLDGVGSGLRGGSFRSNFSLLRTSYRAGSIGVGTTNRGDGLGGRGVRSAPTNNQQE